MKTSRIAQFKAGSAPFVLGLALLATPAFAQTAPADDAAADEATDADIVVTGSLISNPNLEQSTPVNVTTADQIELKQSNVAEEVLRELPGVVPSIGSAVNNGNGGSSYVDLRGLGSTRNIVLLDGNRIVPSGLAGRVDLNNIPLALVERVDALTGAAVTTYGADAITGVVNFVLKRDFAGFEAQASEQITERGDGNTFRIDATIGANFDDGRGNATVSIGYQESDPVYQGARDFSINNIDSFSGAAGGSGTTVPSRITGTRPLTNGVPNVLAPFANTGQTVPNPNFNPNQPVSATNPATLPVLAAVTGGLANGGTRQINYGRSGVAGGGVDGSATAGNYAPFNFNPFNIFQTPFERFNIFAQAHYQISDAVEVYTRGLFSKNTVNTIIAPSGSFGGAVTVNLNNPFLPSTLRDQLCAFNIAPTVTGVNAAGASVSGQVTYTPRFTPAQCAAAATAVNAADPNYRTVDINLSRRTPEVGPRISSFVTTVFDYRIGFRGAITDSINWDISGAYGESENNQTLQNYTLQSRFRQGALVNGTATNPVCQDPSNGCVPVNFFGPLGSITPAAAAFLSATSSTVVRTTLAQVHGVINGDTGVTLPWAAEQIGFAIGGEYRKYGATQRSDLLAQTAGELGGAGGAAPNITGGYDVYEAFGEIIAPIVEDRPFFKSLTIEGGARYSAYTVASAGSPNYDTFTWKAGGSWEPADGFKLRGNYSRAVRAPNIGELFTPVSTGLTNLAVDPCAGSAPVSNANLRAVCVAQGAPAGTIGSILNPTAGQANLTTGGNLNIRPETANTWTIGGVFTPDQIPGFSLSIDYYNIRVTNEIGSPLPGDVLASCFGNITAASASSIACQQFGRNPVTGGLDGDPSTTLGLITQLSNLGVLKTDGIDLIANYRRDLGFADLALSFTGNWTNSSKFQATPASLDRECVGFYSVNCSFTGSIQPQFQFSQRTTLSFDKVDVSLLWRWIDGVSYEPAAFADDLAAAVAAGTNATTGCPDPTGTDPNGCIVDPAFRNIPSESYFDLSARFHATDNITFTLTVQNLFDNQPTVVGSTIGSTSFNSGNVYPSTYDALGRRFAASVKLKF